MKKLIFPIILLILILGAYIGIGKVDPGICNGPYKQQALHISYVKPFVAGYGDLWLGFGNKHWDYEEETYKYKVRECRVKGTNDVFGSDYKVGQKFDMECVWVEEEHKSIDGCAYWYDKYEGEGNIIDLTPWSRKIRKIKDN